MDVTGSDHATTREPVALSWSGGKDCARALELLRAGDRHDVVALFTSVTRGHDRVSIHGVRRALLEAQARAVGLPLVELELEPQSSNEAYEAAFHDAVRRLRARFPAVRRMAFGDLLLEDVRAYRERLAAAAGLESLFPLWGSDTARLATEIVDAGWRAHLVCVDTTQLDARFAGRVLDRELLAELPPAVDPCGERGEYHTFVSAGPIFAGGLAVRTGEVVLRDGRFAFCDLLPAPGEGPCPEVV